MAVQQTDIFTLYSHRKSQLAAIKLSRNLETGKAAVVLA